MAVHDAEVVLRTNERTVGAALAHLDVRKHLEDADEDDEHPYAPDGQPAWKGT